MRCIMQETHKESDGAKSALENTRLPVGVILFPLHMQTGIRQHRFILRVSSV